MKNLHLSCRWVYEWQYNPYNNVSNKKKRLLLVWINKSNYFNHKSLCFYCSKSIDKFNPNSCVLISKTLNPAFKDDTYVWIHKPIVVENADIIKNSWKIIDDKQTRLKISEKVKLVYKTIFDDFENNN